MNFGSLSAWLVLGLLLMNIFCTLWYWHNWKPWIWIMFVIRYIKIYALYLSLPACLKQVKHHEIMSISILHDCSIIYINKQISESYVICQILFTFLSVWLNLHICFLILFNLFRILLKNYFVKESGKICIRCGTYRIQSRNFITISKFYTS